MMYWKCSYTTVYLKILKIMFQAVVQNRQAGPKKPCTSALLLQLKKHKQL